MDPIYRRGALVLATVLFAADAVLISARLFAPMGRKAIVMALIAFALVALALVLQSFERDGDDIAPPADPGPADR
jgi:hypothetical protein